MKYFKQILLFSIATLVLTGGTVGCGKEEVPVGEENQSSDMSSQESDFSWDGADTSKASYAFQYVLDHLESYVNTNNEEGRTYISREYMYSDYDQDGEKEVVLILKFKTEEDESMSDVWFLDYDGEMQTVYVLAKVTNEAPDNYYYYEKDEKMVRLSWPNDKSEYYSYEVIVDSEEKNMMYVLQEAFDHEIKDCESELGGKQLTVYQEGENLPEEN